MIRVAQCAFILCPALLWGQPPATESYKGEVVFGLSLDVMSTAVPLAAGALLYSQDQDIPGIALMTVGAMFGPSVGQFVNGSGWQGGAGVAVRSAGALVLLLGDFPRLMGHKCADCGEPILLGATILSAGALYSLIDTPFAVKRKFQRRAAARAGIEPTLGVSPDGPSRVGAVAWAHF